MIGEMIRELRKFQEAGANTIHSEILLEREILFFWWLECIPSIDREPK